MRYVKKIIVLIVALGCFLGLAAWMSVIARDTIPYTLTVPFADQGILAAWIKLNQYLYLVTGLVLFVIVLFSFFYMDSDNKKHMRRPDKVKYTVVFLLVQTIVLMLMVISFIFINVYAPEMLFFPHLQLLCPLILLSLVFYLFCFILPTKKFLGWM